ncbi:hypothetical protein GW7_17167, partial [Heterocephalus glaber]
NILYSFPGVKQHICALTAFLLSSVAWVLGIIVVSSVSWRMWELKSANGLWDAQDSLRQNNSGTVVDVLVVANMYRGWTQVVELEFVKDLMVLVKFVQPVALILSTVAFLLSRLKPTYPEFLRLYYRSSVLLLCLNSCCVALAVSCNYVMDIFGQSALDFPLALTVGKEAVTKKHFSYVFPLGIVTAALSFLSGILCFGAMSFTELKSKAVADVP